MAFQSCRVKSLPRAMKADLIALSRSIRAACAKCVEVERAHLAQRLQRLAHAQEIVIA